jgi:putative nucleotidyltransferase with HDIG domain
MFESLGSIVVLEHPLERERKDSERIKRLAEEKHEREAYDFSRIIINPERMILNPAMELSTARLKTAMKTNGELRVAPAGPALATVARRIVDERNEAAKQAYQSSYDKWIKALAGLFTRLKANQQVPFQEIDSLAKEIITSYAKDSFYLLNLANNRNGRDAGEYLASHCLNVACIAAGMGAILGFNATQAVEIIIGALFHDVGHMLTYQPLLLKESLDSTEQQKYDEHAQLGVAMLKNVSTLPKSTPFIVYQHHERLDGSGRLLHCFDAAIHDFAKLIAVADEYEILSRKQSPPAAISKTLSGAKDKSLDVMAVRALLLSYSLYPIGSMVLITGNRVCKVVATHPTQFKTPIVRTILSIKDNKYEAVTKRELIDLSTVKGVAVERCISHPVLNRKIGIGF